MLLVSGRTSADSLPISNLNDSAVLSQPRVALALICRYICTSTVHIVVVSPLGYESIDEEAARFVNGA